MKYHHYQPNEKEATPRWGAVWAMSLCAMVLVASEFMPVSLLTPIASDLHMSEGYTGQSIAISGFFCIVNQFMADLMDRSYQSSFGFTLFYDLF
ncbi:MAG: hypothetical protein LRY68_03070 [Sulfurospirillum sp.]|nr:hypothetical protein [Sulfurospirillum sp.]